MSLASLICMDGGMLLGMLFWFILLPGGIFAGALALLGRYLCARDEGANQPLP